MVAIVAIAFVLFSQGRAESDVAPAVGGDAITAEQGMLVNISVPFADEPGDTHTATIDWGDGSAVEAGVVAETDGSGTVSGSHVYVKNGSFVATVCVTDNTNLTGCSSFQVTIAKAKAKFVDSLFVYDR